MPTAAAPDVATDPESGELLKRMKYEIRLKLVQIVIGAASQWQKTIVNYAAVLVLKVIRIY